MCFTANITAAASSHGVCLKSKQSSEGFPLETHSTQSEPGEIRNDK